jgi:hypothetical protein
MPTIEFSGYVFPPSTVQVSAVGGPTAWNDANIRFTFEFRIEKSIVTITCEVEQITDLSLNYAHQVIGIHVRGVIDAIAFSRGTGLRLLIDHCTLPGQEPRPLKSASPTLATLCSLTESELLRLIEKEGRICKPLNDLTETLFDPLDSFVNCQRAIEGIGRLISDSEDRKVRWEHLRNNLNLTRPYLDFVSERSQPARHGGTGPVNMTDVAKVQTRSWTTMNRFLEFRKRNSIKLPLPEFPLL